MQGASGFFAGVDTTTGSRGERKREAKEETGRRESLEDRKELDDELIKALREAEEVEVYMAVPDTPPGWIQIL